MAYDDYEQGERVQEWLRQNGVAIVVGIVIGLALIFGYRQWDQHRANDRAAAATQYQLIENAYATKQDTQALTLTDSLMKNHASSAYAVFAATLRARHELDAGHIDKAIVALQWATDHASDKPLQALSRVRLARAELAADKAEQAIATLKAVPAGHYVSMVAELRGDAQVKLGHADAAAKDYAQALAAQDAGTSQAAIVQMKIDNLAIPVSSTSTVAASTSAPAAPASSSRKQDT